MTLNNLKIGVRLSLGFGAVLALLLAIVAISFLRLEQTKLEVKYILADQERAEMAQTWMTKTQLNITRAVAVAKSSGLPEVAAHFGPLIKQTSDEIGTLQKQLQDSLTSTAGKEQLAKISEDRKVYIAAREAVFAAVKASDQPAADELLNSRMLPASLAYLAGMVKLQEYQQQLAVEHVTDVTDSLSRTEALMGGLCAAALLLGVGMAWIITRSVTRPVRQALDAADVIARNDLSQTITAEHRDEVGDLLRTLARMQIGLREMVTQVRSASGNISTASAEIATGNQDLSTRTEQTASNLQQTASSMTQLTGTVKQSADSARQANQLASSAAEVAARGGQVVSQVVSTMDEINASSKKISDIIGVIDGIAFQTNILALNAAVEAARAGEQGRGFAVVAGEVRSLAGRSAEAAKEIKSLIGASVDRVDAGSKLVADAGRTMQEIVGSVQRVSDIIGEITAASAEQSEGIGQVNSAVTQLDQMTQQNAALVEESAAAAESMKDQAKRLVSLIAGFRLNTNEAAIQEVSAPPVRVVTAAPRATTAPSAPKVVPTKTARPAAAASTPLPAPATTPAAAKTALPATTTADAGDWETF